MGRDCFESQVRKRYFAQIMKIPRILVGAAIALACFSVTAQDTKPAEPHPKTEAPSQEALEAKFKAMLTKATLSGRWSPVDNAQLGPEKKEDRYEIISAGKVKDDQWIINAKMRYGKSEMVLPVPVRVRWAGETAVIIVDGLNLGPDHNYSARVLFFDGMYSGSWNSSTGYGGVLYGTVEHDLAAKKAEGK